MHGLFEQLAYNHIKGHGCYECGNNKIGNAMVYLIAPDHNNDYIQLNNMKNIKGKYITISGPSGVGKSTIINSLLGKEVLVTNEVNNKTYRGRHTTTESRFFKIDENTFIIDTPGFSSFDFPTLKEKKNLETLFPDFANYVSECKFRDCIHINEPNCSIKENVENGNISQLRYNFYLYALNNIFNK